MPYKDIEFRRKRDREKYYNNREAVLLQCKERVDRILNSPQRDEFIKKRRESHRRCYFKHREKYRKTRREYLVKNSLRIMYGLTNEQYNEKLASQNNVCAICGKPETSKTKSLRPLCVDHNHDTKKVRGLLCRSCNLILGFSYESIENLQNAINYLRIYEEEKK